MKNPARIILIACASCFLWPATAAAGLYSLTANTGVSRVKDFCTNSASTYDCRNTTQTYGLDAGYQLSDLFGVELGFGKYASPQTRGLLFGSNLEVTHQIFGAKLSGTITVPISGSFALTGKLGAARTATYASSTYTPGPAIEPYTAYATAFTYGLGMKYSFSDTFALRMQYESIGKTGDETLGTDSLALLTVGLSYHFGKSESRPVPDNTSVQTRPSKAQSPVRVIVFLDRAPGADKQKLALAIAKACQCEPVFVRLYNAKSLMYQIGLAPGLTFPDFKNALFSDNIALGIKGLIQSQ